MTVQDAAGIGVHVGTDGTFLTVATPSMFYYFDSRSEVEAFLHGLESGIDITVNAQPATIPFPMREMELMGNLVVDCHA